eukprot:m.305615 g.305615  ORF g.305615 m.305615 type:complete len:506 (+) comp18040_c0_seq1:3-1520(+)
MADVDEPLGVDPAAAVAAAAAAAAAVAATATSVPAAAGGEANSGGESDDEDAVVANELRQQYAGSTTVLAGNTFFTGVVLSIWDNISGPSVMHIWRSERALPDAFYSKLLPFIPRCTLNSEISRDSTTCQLNPEQKFFVLSEIGFVVLSFAFYAQIGEKDANLFSFALVLPVDAMSAYLELHTLWAERICSLLKRLQVFLRREPSPPAALEKFSAALNPFLINLDSLGVASLTEGIDMSRTVFGPENETQFDIVFLRMAITSHLQTGGVTIVLGHDEIRVNLMINTLAVFLSPDERRRSRYARPDCDTGFAPDLFLQGIVKPANESFDLTARDIVQSQLPSTLINLATNTVRQTKQLNEYAMIHAESERDELQRLQGQLDAPTLHPELLHDVPNQSGIVRQLLERLFRPSPAEIRNALLRQFLRLLHRKALVMIQFVDELGATKQNPLRSDQRKQLRKGLGTAFTFSDFSIILAAAEKLRTGMFMRVYGDPADRQQRLVEMLSTF